MTGATLTIDLDDSEVLARLEELIARMDRPIGFYKEAGDYLREVSIRDNFAKETGPDGTPWAALRPATIARREKRKQTPIRILRASGSAASLSASIRSKVTDEWLEVGTNTIYAGTHQFGAAKGAFGSDSRGRPLPWGDIPARPFLGLSTDDEAELIRIASDWLEG